LARKRPDSGLIPFWFTLAALAFLFDEHEDDFSQLRDLPSQFAHLLAEFDHLSSQGVGAIRDLARLGPANFGFESFRLGDQFCGLVIESSLTQIRGCLPQVHDFLFDSTPATFAARLFTIWAVGRAFAVARPFSLFAIAWSITTLVTSISLAPFSGTFFAVASVLFANNRSGRFELIGAHDARRGNERNKNSEQQNDRDSWPMHDNAPKLAAVLDFGTSIMGNTAKKSKEMQSSCQNTSATRHSRGFRIQ